MVANCSELLKPSAAFAMSASFPKTDLICRWNAGFEMPTDGRAGRLTVGLAAATGATAGAGAAGTVTIRDGSCSSGAEVMCGAVHTPAANDAISASVTDTPVPTVMRDLLNVDGAPPARFVTNLREREC